MIPKEPFRSFLFLIAAASLFLCLPSARADLRLQQKAVVGFPFAGVIDVVQTGSGENGAHRLAVLNGFYILGLQWSAQRGAYDQTFFVEGDFRDHHMILADLNGDGRNDIVVYGYRKDGVTAYDAATGALLRTIHLAESADQIVAQDLDGAPGDEMVVADSGISAYKGDVRLWHSPLRGSLAAATRAAAVQGEVFVSHNQEVIVLDARTGQERRRLPAVCSQSYLSRQVAGQSDLDAASELVCTSYTSVQLVDGMTGVVQWTQPARLAQALTMFDANNDGLDDVIVRAYVDGFKEAVSVLDGRSGAPLGGTKLLQGSGMLLGITNGCEPASIATIEAGGISTSDNLWLLDAVTLDAKSAFPFDRYASTGFAIADFDGDGHNELAVAHDGKVSTRRLEPLSPGDTATLGEGWASFMGMAAAQLDGDAASESVIAGSCGGYVGCIRAWDTTTRAPLWTATMGDEEMPQTVVIADVDGDGADDVLSATLAVASGATGQFVYAFRGRDGKPLWRSVNIPGSTGHLRVADVSGNGTPEVLVMSSTIGIVRLSLSTGMVNGFYEMNGFYNFATVKTGGDARAKLVVASRDSITILDDGQVKAELHGEFGIRTIEIADIDGDGVPEILLGKSGGTPSTTQLQVRSADTLALLWSSEEFSESVHARALQIALGDIDNDGVAEVAVLTSMGVRVLKPDSIAAAATPPRFDSSAALHANVRARSACCATVDLHWDDARPGSAPPLQYRVYRAGTHGEPEVLLATTTRNELSDLYAGGADRYRYSVAVVDAAGHASPDRLTAEVVVGSAARCHRAAGKP